MIQKLCIFGDSLGKGVIFDSIKEKYEFLKDNFAKLFSQDLGVEVDNFSSFGCTVTKGLKTLEKRMSIPSETEPRYAILEYGGNDCDYKWSEISDRPQDDHLPVTPVAQFIETYRKMISSLKARDCQPILMTLPPIDAKRYFEKLSNGLSPKNILQWLGDVDRIYRWHEYYSNLVIKIAEREKCPLIDVRSDFLIRRDCPELICADGIHPNAAGHKIISESLARGIAELLGSGTSLAFA